MSKGHALSWRGGSFPAMGYRVCVEGGGRETADTRHSIHFHVWNCLEPCQNRPHNVAVSRDGSADLADCQAEFSRLFTGCDAWVGGCRYTTFSVGSISKHRTQNFPAISTFTSAKQTRKMEFFLLQIKNRTSLR